MAKHSREGISVMRGLGCIGRDGWVCFWGETCLVGRI